MGLLLYRIQCENYTREFKWIYIVYIYFSWHNSRYSEPLNTKIDWSKTLR